MLANIRKYYKTVVAVIGSILVLLNEITPVTDFLPDPAKHYLTVGITILTAISVFLVKNEPLVEGDAK